MMQPFYKHFRRECAAADFFGGFRAPSFLRVGQQAIKIDNPASTETAGV